MKAYGMKRKTTKGQKHFVTDSVKYVKPQFDVEWEEANRYPYFDKLGQAGWEELAGKGKIVKVVDFGAFVNFFGPRDGLVHISQLSPSLIYSACDPNASLDVYKSNSLNA